METDDAVGAATGNDLGAVADTTTDNAMDLKLAMRQRHTVRKFTSEPLSPELISQLNDRVRANNERLGLAISLKVGDESALPGALKLFFAKGVRNYFVLAGSDRPGLDEDLGYASADLMLFAQALGLNTWWIGGTFSRKNVEQAVPGKKVIGIVAVGFGATLAGGCPLRQMTLAGQGSCDAAVTFVGMLIGAAFAHNFGLAGAAASAATAEKAAVLGGPSVAGQIVLVCCIAVLFVIAIVNVRKQKNAA